MKRKLIQMAGKTMVVSLPSDWVKKYNLKKGEEIDVEERDRLIQIKTEKEQKTEKIKIDVNKINTPLMWRFISSAYIKGVDEIELEYSKKEQKEEIKKIVQTLIGFALIKETEQSVILKEISGSASEFDTILRRVFLMLISLSQTVLTLTENQDKKLLEEVIDKDHNINCFVNFCLRYLNKHGYEDYTKTSLLYATIRELEFVGDEYSDMAKEIMKSKFRMDKNTKKLFTDTNKFLEGYYKLFYSPKFEESLELYNQRKGLLNESRLIEKKTKEEIVIIGYLKTIISSVFHLTEIVFEKII